MAGVAPRADFKLLLSAVDPPHLPAIVAELMTVLQLDRATATSAAQNTPIVLVGGMTQPQAECLRTHIVRLQKLGADLKLTAEPVGKVKQLRWQAPPPATRLPANLFVCPSCGDRFVVQRWQPAVAAPAAPAVATPVAAAPAPAARGAWPEALRGHAPAEEPLDAAPVAAEPLQEAVPVEDFAFAEEVEPLPEAEAAPAEEPLAFAEALAAEPEPSPLAEAAEPEDENLLGAFAEAVEAAEPLPETAPPALPAPRPVPAAAPPRLQPAVARPAPPAEKPLPRPAAPAQPQPAVPRPAMAPKPVAAAPPKPAPAVAKSGVAPKPAAPAPRPAAPPPAPEPEAGGPRYDVSVAKVRPEKQSKLAEIVAERQAITFEEALKLCEKTIVTVCRGGTSVEADDCRKGLAALGLKPIIRKREG